MQIYIYFLCIISNTLFLFPMWIGSAAWRLVMLGLRKINTGGHTARWSCMVKFYCGEIPLFPTLQSELYADYDGACAVWPLPVVHLRTRCPGTIAGSDVRGQSRPITSGWTSVLRMPMRMPVCQMRPTVIRLRQYTVGAHSGEYHYTALQGNNATGVLCNS